MENVQPCVDNVPKPSIDDIPKSIVDDNTLSGINDIPMEEDAPVSNNISKIDDFSNSIKQSLLWIRNKLPIREEYLKNLCITREDINLSLKRVQPSSKREGFATVPDVTWDDVGSLKDVREDLQLAILVVVFSYEMNFEL